MEESRQSAVDSRQGKEPVQDTPMNPSGLRFGLAKTLSDVLDAWNVLYRAYTRANLIGQNPYELHTVPEAIGHHTAVVLACLGPVPVATISAIGDGPLGIPLDTVYHAELESLRSEGKKFLEIGLFGDRRDTDVDMDRSFGVIYEMMRYTFYFGRYTGVTDYLCGIHPRRARLYKRAFGFEPVGDVKSYSTVNDAPVALMRLDIERTLAMPVLPKAADHFLTNPIPKEVFEDRFDFGECAMRNSRLAEYLTHKRLQCAA